MIQRTAVVIDGVVNNVVLIDTEALWTPPEGSTLVSLPDDSRVSAGWTYDGKAFTEVAVVANDPVPVTVSPANIEAIRAQLDRGNSNANLQNVLSSLLDTLDPSISAPPG